MPAFRTVKSMALANPAVVIPDRAAMTLLPTIAAAAITITVITISAIAIAPAVVATHAMVAVRLLVAIATIVAPSVIVLSHSIVAPCLFVATHLIIARHRLIPSHIGVRLLVRIVLGQSWAYQAGGADRQGNCGGEFQEVHFLSSMVEDFKRNQCRSRTGTLFAITNVVTRLGF